jgi:hypothetical protein
MEIRDNILSELREISPLVASVSKQVPYAVPQSYFDGLAMQVMLRIGLEEKTGADPLLNISKENTYKAPEGYFDGLAASILNRIKATETENAQEELELLSPLLGKLERKNPFTPPAGYFDNLSKTIVEGVQAIEFVNEELENLSPLMNSLKEKNVYAVPQGYFENFATETLNKVRHQPAKVISIGFGRKILRYAAAAIVFGVMTLGAYKIINPSNAPEDPIAKVSDRSKVSDQDLESFLDNNTASIADTSAVTTAEISDDDSKDLLADVSDEELQQYLEQHGGPAANANTN